MTEYSVEKTVHTCFNYRNVVVFIFTRRDSNQIYICFLKLQYNIDQDLITIIRLTTIGNVQLAVKINYTT